MKTLLFLPLIAILAFLPYKCGKAQNFPPYDNGGPMPDKDGAIYHTNIILSKWKRTPTPMGMHVQAFNEVPIEIKRLTDEGFQNAITIAKQPPNNYSEFDTHSKYIVEYFEVSNYCTDDPNDPSDGTGFMVHSRSQDYMSIDNDGIFDKDDRVGVVGVCVSGAFHYTTAQGQSNTMTMSLVNHVGTVFNGAWFEGEHGILSQADVPRFLATQFHFEGQGHPIMGESKSIESAKRITKHITVELTGSGEVKPLQKHPPISQPEKWAELQSWKDGNRACLILTK